MQNERMPFEARDSGPFYHGTKAHLKRDELLQAGSTVWNPRAPLRMTPT